MNVGAFEPVERRGDGGCHCRTWCWLFVCVIYSLQRAYKVLASFDAETEAQGGSLPKSRQLVSGRAGILI